MAVAAPPGTTATGPVRRWYRRRLLVVGLPLVLALGTAFFAFVWVGRGAKEVSENDALDRYRAAQGDAQAVSGGERFVPEPGVYRYRATGSERLSLLGTSQRWGPTMWGTVTREGAGCWTLSVLFNTHHDESLRYCSRGGVLYEDGGITNQKFEFVAFSAKDHSVFTCPTPGVVLRAGDRPGASAPIACNGHSDDTNTDTTSRGTIVFVGREHVAVGDQQVETYHVRTERTVGGDQHGTNVNDTWFAVDDGTLVRYTRQLRVTSPSPVGKVTYREHGTFVLVDRSPRR